MMKKILYFFTALLALSANAYAVDASKLLPPEQAFVPQVNVSGKGVNVQFKIADGYYMYRSKIMADTQPAGLLSAPKFSQGKEKEDEFFGRQTVYYGSAQIDWPYAKPQQQYKLVLSYQGCAEVGVCYPPVTTEFDIKGDGVYRPAGGEPADGKNRFLKPAAAVSDGPQSDGSAGNSLSQDKTDANFLAFFSDGSNLKLSWDTVHVNLLFFFAAGIALSFTACMYPLIPIVSSIVVGGGTSDKKRAFLLTLSYTQGLALTYTLVGVVAGLTGALLTVWLQQPWVVLAASAVMVLLALSMFGVFNIQLPASLQTYFQNRSNKLSGGKAVSVFAMGMFSALIVGPCIAPPLAAALGYIGQTGDAVLGGLALYALALGMGLPLILIGTFGSRILPRAGGWMDGVKYAFGFILLAVAVYLATPFLPYGVVAALYTLLLVVPAGLLLAKLTRVSGRLKAVCAALGSLLLVGGVWFGYQSVNQQTTALHRFLTLTPPSAHENVHGHVFTDVAALKAAMQQALKDNPQKPVLLDFYADWCISCKEMAAYTFSDADVQQVVDMDRLFQIDVTANTPEHQALYKEYGIYGPPGLFILRADGSRSEVLAGFAKPDKFIEWYKQHEKP